MEVQVRIVSDSVRDVRVAEGAPRGAVCADARAGLGVFEDPRVEIAACPNRRYIGSERMRVDRVR